MTGIPDVISDNVTDACKRLGCSLSKLFLKAAENCRNGKGFSNNGEVAEHMYQLWVKGGYEALPHAFKEFVLECNEGQHRYEED